MFFFFEDFCPFSPALPQPFSVEPLAFVSRNVISRKNVMLTQRCQLEKKGCGNLILPQDASGSTQVTCQKSGSPKKSSQRQPGREFEPSAGQRQRRLLR